MKFNLLKICLTPAIAAPVIFPIASCSIIDKLATRPRLIDGTDWIGRQSGLLEREDDYKINKKDKSVTYWNLGSLRAHDLVIPNYVMHNGEKYKVIIEQGSFKDSGTRLSGSIELNDFVTEIPANCFQNNESITKVILHNYPTLIGSFAFLNCTHLKSVVVKTKGHIDLNWALMLQKLGAGAFDNCSLSGKLIFGNRLTEIGERAFINCWELTDIDLSMTKLKSIEPSAFMSCGKIRNVSLPSTITTIKEEAFAVCQELQTVSLPKQGMKLNLHSYAFSECSQFRAFTYKNLDIPLELTLLHAGEACFNGCVCLEPREYLEDIDDGESGGTYMESVFEGCGFTYWKLNKIRVDYIESKAFAFNRSLKIIDLTSFYPNDSIPDGWNHTSLYPLDPTETVDVFRHVNVFGTILVQKGFTTGTTFNNWVDWFEKQGLTFGDNKTEPSLEHWNFSESKE